MMFDIERSIMSLTAGAKLTNFIAQLFTFRDTCRPGDLIALLDELEARITDTRNNVYIERGPRNP